MDSRGFMVITPSKPAASSESLSFHCTECVLIFASSFPTNDAFANLLLGTPVVFYQGRGDFTRYVRNWNMGVYYQDEWHISSKFALNYGMRYEIINRNTETRNRLNAFIPGFNRT